MGNTARVSIAARVNADAKMQRKVSVGATRTKSLLGIHARRTGKITQSTV